MASRIDAIVEGIRKELERRPHALDGGGLRSMVIQLNFEKDLWAPRLVIVRPEFHSPEEKQRA